MRAVQVMMFTVCLVAIGAGTARMAAAPKPKASIAVTVSGLGCSTPEGADTFDARVWSWGAANVTDPTGGTGGGAGKAVLSELSLTRLSDACSPQLLAGVVTGKHFPTLTLTQYDGGGVVTGTVLLNDVLITNWQIGGTQAAAEATEQVSVGFSKFSFTDTASGNRFCYDLKLAKQC